MEPIDFEKNIREKLEERRLEPSKNAWQQLEGQLPKAKKKNYTWAYSMAASFIGILIVVSVYYTRNSQPLAPQLVENSTDSIKNSEELKAETITISEEKSIASEENKAVEIQNSKTSNLSKTLNTSQKSSVKTNSKTAKTEILPKIKTEEITAISTSELKLQTKEELFVNQKVNEVVNQVQNLKAENNAISLAEVEKLLEDAQKDLQTQRILNSKKVDAMALLNDVESDLERSFRDKVFDALGEGFNTIRTAVIERNN